MATIRTHDGLTPVLNGEQTHAPAPRMHPDTISFVAGLLHTYTDAHQLYKDLVLAQGDRRINHLKYESTRTEHTRHVSANDDDILAQLVDALAVELADLNAPF